AGQLVTPRRLLQALEPESGGLTPLPPSAVLFKYKKLDHRDSGNVIALAICQPCRLPSPNDVGQGCFWQLVRFLAKTTPP
ncbi:MAG: hypothetical protein ACFCVA_18320, partial [Gammaproteobacteria bacterium]